MLRLSRPTCIATSPEGRCLHASPERGFTTARASGRLVVESCRDACWTETIAKASIRAWVCSAAADEFGACLAHVPGGVRQVSCIAIGRDHWVLEVCNASWWVLATYHIPPAGQKNSPGVAGMYVGSAITGIQLPSSARQGKLILEEVERNEFEVKIRCYGPSHGSRSRLQDNHVRSTVDIPVYIRGPSVQNCAVRPDLLDPGRGSQQRHGRL